MNVTILYGSATGNAEQIARRLAASVNDSSSRRDDHRAFFTTADVMEMNKFKTKKLFEYWSSPPPSTNTTNTNEGKMKMMMTRHALVIVCSTTGNGDPPENATRFVRHIKKPPPTTAAATSSLSSPTLPLTNVSYSVLALGDTNYDKFCEVGKVLDKKLADWGGKRAQPLVCADEATGLEDTVEPWMENVLDKLALAACGVDDDSNDASKSNGSTIIIDDDEEKKNMEEHADSNELRQTATTAINEVTTIKSPTPLYILYGSATGNAEHIAKDLTATYQSQLNDPALGNTCYFPSVICCELNQYKRKCLSDWSSPPHNPTTNLAMKHGVLIVCSTTGNANAPENADRFVRAIKRETNDQLFGHVAYAVLGLGDTNYDVFNATAKLIDKRLSDLGGMRARKATLADEAVGLEDMVEPWKEGIISALATVCKGGGGGGCVEDRLDPTVLSHDVSVLISSDMPSTKLYGPSISSPTEEKKDIEDDDEVINDNTSPTKHVVVNNLGGSGVSTIRKLLCIPPDAVLPSVPTTSLTCVIACLSSCKLLQDEDNDVEAGRTRCDSEIADNVTISSASSGFLFTANRPYESVVLNARYLTVTDVSCAKKVATEILCVGEEECDANEMLIRAMKMYDDHFPISASKFDGWQKKLLCEKNSKRVIEMTLSLPDDFTLEYQPGDSVGLIVSNTTESTQFILDMLQRNHGILPTQKVSIDAANPITVEEVVRCDIDLCSPMKKKGLYLLSNFAQHPEEMKALQWLSGKSGNLYEKFVEQQHRTIIDILQEFPSCQVVTLDGLLGCLSAIPPRYYSVCSSPLHLDKQNGSEFSLKVAFSVVDYYTPVLAEDVNSRRRVGGLATRHLECICSPFLSGQQQQMTKQSIVRIFPKPTIEFRLPSDMSIPLILIGPGTGIAPFIGFLSHRQAQLASLGSCEAAEMASEGTWRGGYELEREELALSKGDARGLNLAADYLSSNQHVGDIDLFFGCRRSDHDYLYKNELEMFKSSGILTNLYTAFSREEGTEKKYVQTLMQNNVECGKRVVEMIMNKGASVYICGDGNAMGKDVQETIISLLATDLINNGKCANLDEAKDRATSHVDQMKTMGRFVLDIWS